MTVDELAGFLCAMNYPGTDLFQHMGTSTQEKYRRQAEQVLEFLGLAGDTNDD